jgi:hypothetical protein
MPSAISVCLRCIDRSAVTVNFTASRYSTMTGLPTYLSFVPFSSLYKAHLSGADIVDPTYDLDPVLPHHLG